MPVLVAWIGEMLLSTVGQMALSALVSLGIGFAANKVASGVIDPIGIKSMLGSAGPLVDYIGWFGIDQAITIILSAWAGRKITDAARVHFVSKRAK
jgi:hypothetical protein